MWYKNIPPSEFDRMAYWEFEEYIKLFNERYKEEHNRKVKENEEYEKMKPKVDLGNFKFDTFKPGNFKMPKI